MAGWDLNPQTGRLEWKDDQGQFHPTRPGVQAPERVPRTEFERDVGVPVGQALDSIGEGIYNLPGTIENIAAGITNYFGAPVSAGQQAPEQARSSFSGFGPVPNANPPMPEYQGGGLPSRVATPAPPELPVDPSLRSREEYMQSRAGRLNPYFERIVSQAERDAGQSDPWWLRLARVAGEVAATGDLSMAGAATGQYFRGEREQQRAAQEYLLRAVLAREGISDQTAEAGFARQSGEHGTRLQNLQNTYQHGVSEAQGQNQWNLSGAQLAQSAANARFQAQLAAWQQQQALLQQYLLAGSGLGGEGGFQSFRQLFSNLPPEIQAGLTEQEARRSLENTISREAQLAGDNAGRQRRAIHARMEDLAGGSIPEPPRRGRNRPVDPQELAQYYARWVDLSSEGVLANYPGFAPAGQ